MDKMQTCGPADWPTSKLQTKIADQVCSLPIGRFSHYLYKSFFPVADVCIITALDIAYLRSIACHMRSHRLKVVIKSGNIAFYSKLISELRSVTCHVAPVIWATSAMLQCCLLSRKDVGRTATALTKSPGSSVRTAVADVIAAVRDTSAENSFVNSCWKLFIDIWCFTCLTASSFWSYCEKYFYF